MEALIYFAVWAGLIFLMMRLGYGAQIMGNGHGSASTQNEPGFASGLEIRWIPSKKDNDPVCGKAVTTDRAKPSVYAGNVYYFCTRECREIFEAAPDQYVNITDVSQKELEHSHA